MKGSNLQGSPTWHEAYELPTSQGHLDILRTRYGPTRAYNFFGIEPRNEEHPRCQIHLGHDLDLIPYDVFGPSTQQDLIPGRLFVSYSTSLVDQGPIDIDPIFHEISSCKLLLDLSWIHLYPLSFHSHLPSLTILVHSLMRDIYNPFYAIF